MKSISLTVLGLILFGTQAFAQNTQHLTCASLTEEHPSIEIFVSKDGSGNERLVLKLQENNGMTETYDLNAKPGTIQQVKNRLLTSTKILVGTTRDSFVSGNQDFFSNSVLVNLMQQQPGLQGAIAGALSWRGSVYSLKNCN